MTKHWSRFDRWSRLLGACRRQLRRLNARCDQLVLSDQIERTPDIDRDYYASRRLINRIDAELKR